MAAGAMAADAMAADAMAASAMAANEEHDGGSSLWCPVMAQSISLVSCNGTVYHAALSETLTIQ